MCGHFFCSDCLRECMMNSATGNFRCPAGDCEKKIFLIDIINLLPQEDLKVLFKKQKEPFLQRNQGFFKQCPSANCDNILIKQKRIGSLIKYAMKRKKDRKKGGIPEAPPDESGLLAYREESMIQDSQVIEEESKIDPEIEKLEMVLREPGLEDDPNLEGTKRLLVFCECCGHDYCFNCLKNHYEDDCEVDRIKDVCRTVLT